MGPNPFLCSEIPTSHPETHRTVSATKPRSKRNSFTDRRSLHASRGPDTVAREVRMCLRIRPLIRTQKAQVRQHKGMVGTHRTRALTRGSHAVGAAMRYLPLRLFPWQQPLSWLCTARNVHKTRPPAGARRKRRVRRSESGWKRAWAGRPTLQTPAVSRLLPRASATASESLTRRARRLGRARRGLLTGRFGSREARETASWPTVKTRIAFSSPPRAARARAVAGETRIRRDSRLGREETLCPVPPPPAPALRGSESV